MAANPSNGTFSIAPGTVTIDTNCTGCNATNSSGASVEQFTATLAGGGAASVTWKVSGGDANSGAGTINASGQYTPPSYLTADSVQVTGDGDAEVEAERDGERGADGDAGLSAAADAGERGAGRERNADDDRLPGRGRRTARESLTRCRARRAGSSGGQGSLGATNCTRSGTAFTYCTVTYTAPATIAATAGT